jgi:type I site-specific restriction endonuclease
VQLGLTATPKRKDNVDTYDYYGEPVYSYTLKEGDFNRIITNDAREQKRIEYWMDRINPKEKAIVFCATQKHAGKVCDMVNEYAKQRMFDDLPQFFENEDHLRVIWSDPTTREKLYMTCQKPVMTKRSYRGMKELIDAQDSDVLAFVAYAAETIRCLQRVKKAHDAIESHFSDKK